MEGPTVDATHEEEVPEEAHEAAPELPVLKKLSDNRRNHLSAALLAILLREVKNEREPSKPLVGSCCFQNDSGPNRPNIERGDQSITALVQSLMTDPALDDSENKLRVEAHLCGAVRLWKELRTLFKNSADEEAGEEDGDADTQQDGSTPREHKHWLKMKAVFHPYKAGYDFLINVKLETRAEYLRLALQARTSKSDACAEDLAAALRFPTVSAP